MTELRKLVEEVKAALPSLGKMKLVCFRFEWSRGARATTSEPPNTSKFSCAKHLDKGPRTANDHCFYWEAKNNYKSPQKCMHEVDQKQMSAHALIWLWLTHGYENIWREEERVRIQDVDTRDTWTAQKGGLWGCVCEDDAQLHTARIIVGS